MKKIILIIISISILYPLISYAIVLRPFGGKVITTKPCDEGLLLTVKTPSGATVPYMWIMGNLPYLSRQVPYVSQNILGMTRTAVIPCTVSGVPYAGGLPIQYHGSSY